MAQLDSIELGKTKAEYLRAQARLDLARENLEREEKLYTDRITSEQEVLEARTAFREATVDLATTERLAAALPEGVVLVAESGIFTHADVTRLEAAGAHAFLVGEALMRETDVGAALRSLRRSS